MCLCREFAVMALIIVMIVGLTSMLYAAEDTQDGNILPELAPYKGVTRNDIDVSTLKGKVMVGYQGWFRALGDGVKDSWVHWSSNGSKITADTLTVDMWPDMSDYPKSEQFPVEGLKHKDGSQACLFSSARPKVVDLHFKWMKEYGIDGAFVQRFVCGCENPNSLHTTGPLAYSRDAANRYGRAFAVTYDMSGTPTEKLYDMMVNDWKFLVDKMKLTQDKRYLHHNGKPVLEIYGFFEERFPAEVANKIIDFFKNDPEYGTFLIGSGAWWWRSVKDPEWAKVFRRFDAIKPWNVGNTMTSKDGKTKMANTDYWQEDIREAKKHGIMYMPVIYPGFTWDNLMRVYKQPQNVGHPILRRGGEFLWEQYVTATELKVDTIFAAMFDEVDEGTAIFKVTNDPPVDCHFVTYDGKPSDWYLRLTGRATKMFRGEIPLERKIPSNP